MNKRDTHIGIFFIAMVISSMVFASSDVARDIWADYMQKALPEAFCQEGSYFRSCFQANKEQCTYIADSVTSECLARYNEQIPDSLNQPEDGTYWGEKIGGCAGTLFEYKLLKVRISSQKCDNPANWQ